MRPFFPDQFYASVIPLLDGRLTPEEALARLSPNATATADEAARLAYYRTLVERNLVHLLGQLYPATVAHLGEKFVALARRYAEAHPARHHEPNSYGAAFPKFLDHLAAVADVSSGAAELADYEWLMYAASVAHEVSDELDGVQVTRTPSGRPTVRAILRQYDHDVPGFVRAVRRDPQTAVLVAAPTYVLVHQVRSTGRGTSFTPSRAELLFLARIQGVELPEETARMSAEEEAAAAQRLAALDIIDNAFGQP